MSNDSTSGDGGGSDGKVVDLATAKRKGAPRSGGAPQTKTKQAKAVPLCRHWLQVVNGKSEAPFAPKFHVWEPEPGKRVLLVGADEVAVAPVDALEAALLRHSQEHYALHDYALSPTLAKEAARYWVKTADPIAEPATVLWADEPGLTFRRLPWPLAEPLDGGGHGAPTWDALLGRISDNQAFIAWVGSLFAPAARNHQYVFLYGEGADGKGAINRFLARVFGGAYAAKQPPSSFQGSFDKFWTHGLIGKRVVAFPDCNNTSFMASGLFKSLVGGDPLDAEAKHAQAFTFTPRCKCIIFSNEKPKISSELADMRRIIYCQFVSRGEYSPDFEDRLWAEGGSFLRAAIAAYRSVVPDGAGDIPTEKDAIQQVVDDLEADHEALFQSLFKPAEAAVPANILLRSPTAMEAAGVSPLAFQTAVGRCLKHRHKRIEFTSWLEKRHGVKKQGVKVPVDVNGGVRVDYWYVGVQLRHPAAGNVYDADLHQLPSTLTV